MHIKASIQGNTAVIRLTGVVNYLTSRMLREGSDELLQQSRISILEIDLYELEYINSSVIGSFLLVHELARQYDKELRFSNLRGFVLRVFEQANLHQHFTIVPCEVG